jgi:hypothetical protein
VSAGVEHADGRRALARGLLASALLASALGGFGCSVGQGEGSATSADLYVPACWEGPFDLRPTFFGANPFDDTLTIRVQRGEREIGVSDGYTMLISNVQAVRTFGLDTDLPLGLPLGVTPFGYPLPPLPNPPAASLTLYLNNSCRRQNSLLYSVSGSVRFSKLFSGDLSEENAEDRITRGSFSAVLVDPRDAVPDLSADAGVPYRYPSSRTSVLEGDFDFVFHRGIPAQPFP